MGKDFNNRTDKTGLQGQEDSPVVKVCAAKSDGPKLNPGTYRDKELSSDLCPPHK